MDATDNDASVYIDDNAIPALSRYAGSMPGLVIAAVGRVGQRLAATIRGRLRKGASAFGWPDTTSVSRYRLLAMGAISSSRYGASSAGNGGIGPYGNLIPAVRSRVDRSSMEVEVGWIDPSTAVRAERLQEGGRISVTAGMRSRYLQAGMPLRRSTSEISVPGRPVIAPMAREFSSRFNSWFEEELAAVLDQKGTS